MDESTFTFFYKMDLYKKYGVVDVAFKIHLVFLKFP